LNLRGLVQKLREVLSQEDTVLFIGSTEKFVEEVLLPLLGTAPKGRVRNNLVSALIAAGRRHGRRYVPNE
jgi:hypothetical protein